MVNLDDMTRKFLLGEQKDVPSTLAYVQALSEIIGGLRANTQREARKLEIAKAHIREITRSTRKLMEENRDLQEQVRVLEETKEK